MSVASLKRCTPANVAEVYNVFVKFTKVSVDDLVCSPVLRERFIKITIDMMGFHEVKAGRMVEQKVLKALLAARKQGLTVRLRDQEEVIADPPGLAGPSNLELAS